MSGSSPIAKMEDWKEVEEFPNYLISNKGNVKRKSREFKDKFITINGSTNNRGYRYFQVHVNGKEHRKNLQVHRCVAKAFILNPENMPCVDHIDNNPLNNDVSNLRWCTQADNCKNQRQRIVGKKNAVVFDKKREWWIAWGRENNKTKFLGYHDTYNEAKEARERWENNNDFYKKGNDENYSTVTGKQLTRRKKGTGTIQLRRETGKWRTVLVKDGCKIIDLQFNTYEEAHNHLDTYLTSIS